MYKPLTFILLAFLLAACGNLPAGSAPAVTPAPTETPVSPTAAFTSSPTRRVEPVETIPPTLEAVPIPATPLPPEPTLPPMITPDTMQVERWKEHQTELAKGILPMDPFKSVLCEWDILARAGQEIYVWAVCASPRGSDARPAVIHVGVDGSIQSVEIPQRGSGDSNKWFPEAARVKFSLYTGDSIFSGRLREMYNHIKYRRTHLTEPPLIVLSATSIPAPTP